MAALYKRMKIKAVLSGTVLIALFIIYCQTTCHDKKLFQTRLEKPEEKQNVFLYQHCRTGNGDGGVYAYWFVGMG